MIVQRTVRGKEYYQKKCKKHKIVHNGIYSVGGVTLKMCSKCIKEIAKRRENESKKE